MVWAPAGVENSSGMPGSVLPPPSLPERLFGIAGARQAMPVRDFAPQRWVRFEWPQRNGQFLRYIGVFS
jgi:hypothetical protein